MPDRWDGPHVCPECGSADIEETCTTRTSRAYACNCCSKQWSERKTEPIEDEGEERDEKEIRG